MEWSAYRVLAQEFLHSPDHAVQAWSVAASTTTSPSTTLLLLHRQLSNGPKQQQPFATSVKQTNKRTNERNDTKAVFDCGMWASGLKLSFVPLLEVHFLFDFGGCDRVYRGGRMDVGTVVEHS